MYVYFPSCNYTRASKECSDKIKEYLSKQEHVRVEGCCRPGHKKLTSEDIALTVCQTCSAIVREDSEATDMSIFEWLDQDPNFVWPDYHGERMYIQDCYKARNKANALKAIRSVMKKMNIEIIELPNNYEKADYCGTFYYNKMLPANMKFAPKTFIDDASAKIDLKTPEEQEALMKEYCKQFDLNTRVVVYCNSCLRGLKMGGANGIHLMDLVVRDL